MMRLDVLPKNTYVGREQMKQNETRLNGKSRLFVHMFKHILNMVITVFVLANPSMYKQCTLLMKRRIVKIVVTILQALFPHEEPDVFTMSTAVAEKHLDWSEAYQPFSCSVAIKTNKIGDIFFVPPCNENLPQYMTLKGRKVREIIISGIYGTPLNVKQKDKNVDVSISDFIHTICRDAINIDSALKPVRCDRILTATTPICDLNGALEFGKLHNLEIKYARLDFDTEIEELSSHLSNLMLDGSGGASEQNEFVVHNSTESNTCSVEEHVEFSRNSSTELCSCVEVDNKVMASTEYNSAGAKEPDEVSVHISPEYHSGGALAPDPSKNDRRWPLRVRIPRRKFEIIHTNK